MPRMTMTTRSSMSVKPLSSPARRVLMDLDMQSPSGSMRGLTPAASASTAESPKLSAQWVIVSRRTHIHRRTTHDALVEVFADVAAGRPPREPVAECSAGLHDDAGIQARIRGRAASCAAPNPERAKLDRKGFPVVTPTGCEHPREAVGDGCRTAPTLPGEIERLAARVATVEDPTWVSRPPPDSVEEAMLHAEDNRARRTQRRNDDQSHQRHAHKVVSLKAHIRKRPPLGRALRTTSFRGGYFFWRRRCCRGGIGWPLVSAIYAATTTRIIRTQAPPIAYQFAMLRLVRMSPVGLNSSS